MKRNGIDTQPHFSVLRKNQECRESDLELKERRDRIDAAVIDTLKTMIQSFQRMFASPHLHIKETPR